MKRVKMCIKYCRNSDGNVKVLNYKSDKCYVGAKLCQNENLTYIPFTFGKLS